ncbi:hypothetical protein RFI_00609 [Reticulomyxa filosa]|uniref:Uncharacterized protein n=1 Tax=Reticulomyxa filosa TaxID=46433 RepID=X6PFK5_RETFI|nr:hypothetical protein RFI_00609 [Reticulomyxa filosa]|eukprot:ETO36452.1 hypothetical protein RFI_00609 [Reticulomyxa filosa]
MYTHQNRVTLYLRSGLLPEDSLDLFQVKSIKKGHLLNKDPLKTFDWLERVESAWKAYDQYGVSFLLEETTAFWKQCILYTSMSNEITKTFQLDDTCPLRAFTFSTLSSSSNSLPFSSCHYSIHPNNICTTTLPANFFFSNPSSSSSSLSNCYYCTAFVCQRQRQSSTTSTPSVDYRVVFLARTYHASSNRAADVVHNSDIWSNDIHVFESVVQKFNVTSKMSSIKLCSLKFTPSSAMDFVGLEIATIKFVDSNRLALLASLHFDDKSQRSCLIVLDVNALRFEDLTRLESKTKWSEFVFDDENNSNMMAISINDVKKLVLPVHCNALKLACSGVRNMIAIGITERDDAKLHRVAIVELDTDEPLCDTDDDESIANDGSDISMPDADKNNVHDMIDIE